MRTYDVLILGIETKIGQKAFSLLEQDYGYLSVAVPLSEYSRNIRYPQNQVKIDYSNEKSIKSIASSFKIIVAFDQKKIYKKLMIETKDKFIDASKFTLQMVIELFKEKATISSDCSDIELNIKASFRHIFSFIFYPKKDYMPTYIKNGYSIAIGELELNSDTKFNFNLIFSTHFFSIIFLILGIIFKPIILLLQAFGFIFTIPFNEHSIQKESIFIKWKNKNTNKKKQIVESKYYIDPNQDENEVICDYFRLKLIYILKLTNSEEQKSKLKSINVIQKNKKTNTKSGAKK